MKYKINTNVEFDIVLDNFSGDYDTNTIKNLIDTAINRVMHKKALIDDVKDNIELEFDNHYGRSCAEVTDLDNTTHTVNIHEMKS